MGISLEKIAKWEKSKKVKKLLRVLNDDSVEARIHAIRALATIQNPDILNPLVNLLRDPNPDIRLASVEALGKIGSGKTMEFVRFMLEKENDTKVLEAAKIALATIREQARKEEESA